jgi:hypothetical protein
MYISCNIAKNEILDFLGKIIYIKKMLKIRDAKVFI